MFWKSFSWFRLGPIVPLRGSVTGSIHANTIRHYVVPTLHKYFPHDNGTFQEDNATHTVQKSLKKQVKELELQCYHGPLKALI
jgi:hypothetical protein